MQCSFISRGKCVSFSCLTLPALVCHIKPLFRRRRFVFQSVTTLTKELKTDEAKVCLSVCLSVCVSLASDSSETIEVIVIKRGAVPASDMVMSHVLNILSLTGIQGHRS